MKKSFARICLAGEDLDWTGRNALLCNVDLKTIVSIERIKSSNICIESNIIGKRFITRNITQTKFDYSYDEFDYIIGAINIFEKYYYRMESVRILIDSNVPPRSGLSSSASLLISFFLEAFRFYKIEYNKHLICKLSYETEYNELRCQVGKMDFISCSSQGLLLYRSQDDVIEKLVNPFRNMDLLLINCGEMSSTREINKKKYNRYISKEEKFMRYLEYGTVLVNEIYNKIISEDSVMEIADLINRYQYIMRDYLEACTSRIDNIVMKSLNMGAICSKLTGCGGGGYVFSIFKSATSQECRDYLEKESIPYIECKML